MKKIQGDGGMLSKAVESLRENGKGKILPEVVAKKTKLNCVFTAQQPSNNIAQLATQAATVARGRAYEQTHIEIPNQTVEYIDPETGEASRRVISGEAIDLNG